MDNWGLREDSQGGVMQHVTGEIGGAMLCLETRSASIVVRTLGSLVKHDWSRFNATLRSCQKVRDRGNCL